MREKPTIEDLRGAFRGMTRTIVCPICGKTVALPEHYGWRRKYCPDCSAAVSAKREKERKHKRWLEVKERRAEAKKNPPKKRESKVDNLAAAARAAGMSYGRYVALKEAGRI